MPLKCSNCHEYFEDFITLDVKFFSSEISGYSVFNLHCKMPYVLCIIVGNNISVVVFSRKKKRKIELLTFCLLKLPFYPCSYAGDYIGKGGKQLRSIYCLLDKPGQKTDFWDFLPLEAYSSFDCTYRQLCLKCISSPLWQWNQRGAILDGNSGLTDLPDEVAYFFCWL